MMAQGKPIMSFEKQEYNLGTIRFNSKSKIKFVYHFKNTGNAPLIIHRVETSCGCTISEWSRKAVFPGKKGYVNAILDLKGRIGIIRKTLFVYSTASNKAIELHINGMIK